MKKILAMLCAAAVLTGCAAKGTQGETEVPETRPVTQEEVPETETEAQEETTAEETEQEESVQELFTVEAEGINYLSVEGIELPEGATLAMIGKDSGSSFWKRVRAGAEQAVDDLNTALGYTGDAKVKLTYDAPTDESVAEQIDIIDQMLDKNPDALLIGFVDVNSGRTQLELAESNGVPVLTVDSSIENSLIVSETRTDNYRAGAEAAQAFCEAIGDSGQIALLVHSSKTETGIERERGFTEEIENNHPDVEIVNVAYMDQDERSTDNIVAGVLSEYPELKGYFGLNDDVTRGLLDALDTYKSEEHPVIGAGFDASEKLVQAVSDGRLAGVMAQNPFAMGYAAAVSAFRAIAHMDNASVIETGHYWISAENVNDARTEMLTYK